MAHNAKIQHSPCTAGAAQSLFQELPLGSQVMRPRGQDHPGLLEATARCQYRLFRDGNTVTFCEDDFILGGIVWATAYKADGISRAAAIADIEATTDRAWLDGQEQVLKRTAYKDVNSAELGLAVFQHRAFITQLPPGDHVSLWTSTFPGFPDETATVTVRVLPRAQCT
jgi:hypothetical protein